MVKRTSNRTHTNHQGRRYGMRRARGREEITRKLDESEIKTREDEKNQISTMSEQPQAEHTIMARHVRTKAKLKNEEAT